MRKKENKNGQIPILLDFKKLLFTLIIIMLVSLPILTINVKANKEPDWSSNWEKNDIERLSKGAQWYEGHEINRPAVLNGEVYYLYQRPTSRPANPFLRYNDTPVFTFTNEDGSHPQTFWMHYKHGDEILWVGQILQLNSSGDILYLPAATVLLKDNSFYEAIIPDTVNCNELIGVSYYNGKWYAGERSGDTFNYYTPTYPRGGGLWESTDGLNWVRDTRPIKEDPIKSKYGRELLLATLNGHLYGFYQGSSNTKTLIRRLNTDENICESPSLNQGLVPFQIHQEGFDWKGYIPLRTGEDLGWFDGDTLKFQHFEPIDGREVQDAIPIGIYENNLVITVRSGNEYTVLSLSEPFGKPVKIADNWMEGWGVRGTIDGDYAYLGVRCSGYSALDRLFLKEILPTEISVSSLSSASVGSEVGINGRLICNEKGVSEVNVLLRYSLDNGETWNDITEVKTTTDGHFSVFWIPSTTGNSIINAVWAGNETLSKSNTTYKLYVTSLPETFARIVKKYYIIYY